MYGFVINPHLDYTDKIIQKLKSLHEQREKKRFLERVLNIENSVV